MHDEMFATMHTEKKAIYFMYIYRKKIYIIKKILKFIMN
ncbi:hypothetical protein HMPREF1040_1174 [Megasphaera sp. UPII 135-E]|nr:hypothetical protein HMPREF1040_1174 [Megasphaera sp. UPII 135-E]